MRSRERTRARVRLTITERDRVFVEDFVVKGNRRTEKSVILRRLQLRRGGIYSQDLVRQSEERLATLGVFSSVSVALEDAEVPQRRKRVIINVVESDTFSLGAHLGFSTGEGVRFGADFEGRNIGGLPRESSNSSNGIGEKREAGFKFLSREDQIRQPAAFRRAVRDSRRSFLLDWKRSFQKTHKREEFKLA